jgi:hypothetical protein
MDFVGSTDHHRNRIGARALIIKLPPGMMTEGAVHRGASRAMGSRQRRPRRGSSIIHGMPLSPPRGPRKPRRPHLFIAMTLAALGACNEVGPARGPSSGDAVVLVKDDASARASIGRRVRVRGVAHGGKLSAVIGGDLHVYCLDRDRWPDELEGQLVEAEGVLEVTDEFAATEGPGGEITQGTSGADLVLRRSTVRLVDRQ